MANDIIARLRLSGQQFTQDSKSAFSAFNTDAQSSASAAKAAFQSNFDQIQQIARNALTLPRTDTGSLNINVSGYQAAAAAANSEAIALREVATAARLAADSAGDTSASTRLLVAGYEAAAIEGEKNAATATVQADAMAKLQTELNRTKTAVLQEAAANDTLVGHTNNATASKQIFQHVLRSTADSFAAGLPPMMIFGEQIGRIGEAAALAGGEFGAVGTFLAGPWGIALTAGVAVLGPFVAKLFDAKDAATEAKIGADGLSDAQGVLGKMFDLTSGKLEHQNDLLRLNARLTAINLRGDAIKENDSAQDTFRDSGSASLSYQAAAIFSRTPGTSPISRLGVLNSQAQAVQDLLNSVQSGSITKEAGLEQADKLDFTGLKVTKTQFEQALVDSASADAKKQVADAIDKSLDTNSLDPSLRRDGRTKRPKKAPDTDPLVNSVTNDIATFTGQFTDAPTFIEKADAALRKLTNDAEALNKKKGFIDPDTFAKLQDGIASTKKTIEDNLDKPYNDFLKTQEQSFQVSKLLASGHTDEAAALQQVYVLQKQMGPLTDDQRKGILDTVQALRAEQDAQQRLTQSRQQDLQALDSVKQAIEGVFTGSNKIQDIPKQFLQAFQTLQGQQLFDRIFSSAFQDLQDQVNGVSTVRDASAKMAEAMDTTINPLNDLATAAADTAKAVAGMGAGSASPSSPIGPVYASDGTLIADPSTLPGSSSSSDAATNEIVVTARKVSDSFLSAVTVFDKIGAGITSSLDKLGIHLPKAITDNLGTLLQGAGIGGTAGGIFASITGGKTSKTGSAIGGALGDVAGKAIGKSLGSALGSLGKFAGPLGAVAGGILGGVLGGLLKSVPHGASTITGSGGTLSASAGFGNNKAAEAAASGEANTVIQGIQQVAQQLGAVISGNPNITVGTYKGKYRVNTQGTQLGGSKSPVAGLTDFGDDEEAAVQYAVEQSISKGVISGISQASINILKSGQDLQTAITKATAIESIPKTLKGILDPVGEAIDQLNEQFNTYMADLKEGGATTEQIAQAQQLYNLQLGQIKASTASASATLKDFLQSLKVGSDSPLSLRDQEGSAKAALQPYLDSITAGQTIDQSKYQDAAQAFLDIERQLYGSTDAYFQQFDAIQAATTKAIATIDNATPIASPANASDPFASATATATQATATSTQTTAEILAQQTGVLTAQGQTLQQILAALSANGNSFASGSQNRNFA